MIGWMPKNLKQALASLLQTSSNSPSKVAEIYGSDMYSLVVEEDKKRRLAEDAEAVRKQRNLPNLG